MCSSLSISMQQQQQQLCRIDRKTKKVKQNIFNIIFCLFSDKVQIIMDHLLTRRTGNLFETPNRSVCVIIDYYF